MSFICHNLTKEIYNSRKDEFVELYLHAFTTGENAQYISRETAEESLDWLMKNGNGRIVLFESKLTGILIGVTLNFDADFPIGKHPEILPDKSVYIAEVLVHTDARGQGIASKLIRDYLELDCAGKYSGAVIRVWDKNIPALSLYKKLGFIEIDEIKQTKLKSPTETFEMRKVYLHKKMY